MKFTRNGIGWNELDLVFVVDLAIGSVMFVSGLCFDLIARHFLWRYSSGFNLGQIVWCGFWLAYVIFIGVYQVYYGE